MDSLRHEPGQKIPDMLFCLGQPDAAVEDFYLRIVAC